MVVIDITQAAPLQSAIQKKLADYGYSEGDDPVMAEYVTVMLANKKTADQITGELSELIGSDYDSAFTEWIFSQAIPEYYSKPASPPVSARTEPPTSAASTSTSTNAQTPTSPSSPMQTDERARPAPTATGPASTSSIQTVQDSRERSHGGRNGQRGVSGLPNRPHGGGGSGGPPRGQGGAAVFGNAMAGIKRGGDHVDRPNRRQRMSDHGGDVDMSQDDRPKGRSIFDRAGVRPGTAAPYNSQNGSFDNRNNRGRMNPQSQPPMQAGPFGGMPQIPGLPQLHIPDNFNSLPPAQQQAIQQQIFQHQLIAAAAAQQMYAGAGPQINMSPSMLSPHAVPFPGAGVQDPSQMAVDQPSVRKPSKSVVLPVRPTSEELCKYGVDCKNAICKYSHPSPSATKESGLVLSKDVCDKGQGGVDCTDKDCPKSHVSPAQKTDPQGLNVAQYKQKAAAANAPPAAVPTAAAAIAAPNPGAKPCMYGAGCTRPGCFFAHPPNHAITPCRFGLACTRPDCHFQHPPGRRQPSSYSSFAQPKVTNRSATFGTNGSTAAAPAAVASSSETNGEAADESKMSARMKKFTGAGQGGERIVAGDASTASDQDKENLEVVM